MSAYASLPGSFLPPFFSFGASSSSSASPTENGTEGAKSEDRVDTSYVNNNYTTPQTSPSVVSTKRLITNNISPSTFKTLALSSDESDAYCKPEEPLTTSSQPSDIIIAIQSARVNPVELIKSLTSKGSNIARRTANFIARTPSALALEDVGSNNTKTESSVDNTTDMKNSEEKEEEVSIFSRPGLCYEDTDSDEEYSMYDYSDDFSSPHDNDHDGIDDGDFDQYNRQNSYDSSDSSSDNGDDPSAIEFELSITFQGRKYNATRAYPSFIKLREDLLSEMNKNNKSRTRNCSSGGAGGGAKSPSDLSECTETSNLAAEKEDEGSSLQYNMYVPELPRVSPQSLGHGAYAFSQGVARSGFALLQATAQHYCPEMEKWMIQIIDTFPCSQSLSSFLWEPLSSSSAGWDTIGEEGCGQTETLSPLNDTKPPLHSHGRSNKTKISSSKPTTLRKNRSMGSLGSLNSIQEGFEGGGTDDDW